MVWVYFCKECGKRLGVSQGGKRAQQNVKVQGDCCYELDEYLEEDDEQE